MRFSAAVGLAAVALLVSSSASAAEKSGGHSFALFNGKNLDGWTVENGCKVSVKDGAMLLEEGNGWVRSHYPQTNFKLHVEWKALKKADYDAGIYIRTPNRGKPFPRGGYQINLLQGKEGNIGNLNGAASTGLIKPGVWNTFDVTVIGETVELHINGKQAYKVGGLKNPSGFVGLQVEEPKGGQFLVRKFEITELGHKSLFNGRDLAGWEGAGRPASDCWAVENDELVCLKKRGPWLRTKQQYGDFNLRLEYKVGPNGNSGVYVRVPENGNHHRKTKSEKPAGFEVQILDDGYGKKRKLKDYQYCGSVYDIAGATSHVGKKPGEWNTLEINCRAQNITTLHNGVLIVSVTPESHPLINLRKLKGYLGLQNHGGGVNFRNLRIGPASESYAFADAKSTGKTAKAELKPLSKPVKNLFPGTWNVELVVDKEKAGKFLKASGVPNDKIEQALKAFEQVMTGTKITVVIKADGTSVSTVRSKDPAGNQKKEVENERWKFLKSKGRTATIQLTRKKDGKDDSRTIKVTFLDDNAFQLEEDPDLKDAPLKKPIFRRAKKNK